MSEDKFDAIIVGGGLAGCTAAYLLAQSGLEVIVIERGNFAGAKNVTGGRIYAHALESIIPNFAEEAPIERCITHEKLSFLTEDRCVTTNTSFGVSENLAERSYSVLRSKFDPWLADKAEAAGANIIPGIRVDDIIVRDDKVCGIIAAGEEMEADVVILADGINSILGEKLGMTTRVSPETCAVGVKEIIGLDSQIINDRFGCHDKEGAAWIFSGAATDNHMGGGFIYTNEDSLSLGIVLGLHAIGETENTVPQMMENFKNHPLIKPLVSGGTRLEYSAHLVAEAGYNMMPELVRDGVLIVGDAAGFCLNIGFTIRGMDLAIASAQAAANAVIAAKEKKDFSKSTLLNYKQNLEDSFVMKDLKLYKKLPSFLQNKRIFNEYPQMVTGIMNDMYTINGASKPMRKMMMPHLKKVGLFNLIKDGIKGGFSL